MKTSAFLAAILCMLSCSPYPKGLHDDCRLYLKKFRAQWHRLPNGFYTCDDLTEPRKSKVFTNAYLVEQEWAKHEDCLFQLSPKEVKMIFGNPSKIVKGKNELYKFESTSYYYFIKDTICNPKMAYPFTPGEYAYNRLVFVFYKGGPPRYRQRPTFELPCEIW